MIIHVLTFSLSMIFTKNEPIQTTKVYNDKSQLHASFLKDQGRSSYTGKERRKRSHITVDVHYNRRLQIDVNRPRRLYYQRGRNGAMDSAPDFYSHVIV